MLSLHHAGLIDAPSLSPLHGEVTPGEVLAIVGPNGAGKTTLLTMLSGFRQSQLGAITLDGWSLDAWTPAALAGRRALVAQFEPTGFDWRVRDLVVLSGDPGEAAVAEIMGNWRSPAWPSGACRAFPVGSVSASWWPGRCASWPRHVATMIGMVACCCWMSRPALWISVSSNA
ncbi:hemin import ATP-binding protein HmuV [Halomonas elongata]|uniref:Hemin import ATP-binding protein HmuV n=1 Tax=Halomonas elongata TaxID=2746 RepID=A0A1B8P306_HALEL|nr:ATP-binding cassette domain-containing protein [Halomonas elongata]OBX36608.1 hemin import ATP-binding protein HmuV [Halomonas elongata]